MFQRPSPFIEAFFSFRSLVVLMALGGLFFLGPLLIEGRPRAASLPTAMPGSKGQVHYLATLESDLSEPLAVAIGPTGDVYVADSGNGVVRRFSRDGLFKGAVGSKAEGPPSPGSLVYPVGLAVDEKGRLYVADNMTGRISVFDEEGGFEGYFAEDEGGGRPFGTPGSLFYKEGHLYVSDLAAHRVAVLLPDGTVARTLGAGKGPGPEQLLYPGSVWADEVRNVYVADANNNRIQVFSPEGSLLRSISNDLFDLPRGIVMDAMGKLHISNTLGHRISVFTRDGQHLFSYGGSGSAWHELGFPTGIAIAGDRLYVADRANNRMQIFSLTQASR